MNISERFTYFFIYLYILFLAPNRPFARFFYFYFFNTYHEFGTMYEDKHTPLLSANLCAQQIMAASP